MNKRWQYFGYLVCLSLLIIFRNNRSSFTQEILTNGLDSSSIIGMQEFKPIEVPRWKYNLGLIRVYNPALITTDSGYLIVYRQDELYFNFKRLKFSKPHCLRCSMLDKQLCSMAPSKPLVLFNENGKELDSRFTEDPRIIPHRDEYVLLFNVLSYTQKKKAFHNTMRIAKLKLEDDVLTSSPSYALEHPTTPMPREKNWIPLSHSGQLYITYKADPLELFIFENNKAKLYSVETSCFPDSYGFIFGSTPYVKTAKGYLTLYHAHSKSTPFLNKRANKTYLFGAYLLSDDLKVTAYTPPNLGNQHLYSNYFNHRRICFPSALIRKDPRTLIAGLGVNDSKIIFLEIDENRLLNAL
jgi:predicted GH43/DUF377 family glycosyl hydrolase